uniref:N19B2.065 protein n=1 Tax=Trypanosoma brucei TaxID=5691 RepID=Q8WPQ5_9TRYP|nr:N19B2.065 [Trypanosoma brucei]
MFPVPYIFHIFHIFRQRENIVKHLSMWHKFSILLFHNYYTQHTPQKRPNIELLFPQIYLFPSVSLSFLLSFTKAQKQTHGEVLQYQKQNQIPFMPSYIFLRFMVLWLQKKKTGSLK